MIFKLKANIIINMYFIDYYSKGSPIISYYQNEILSDHIS